MSGLLPNNNKSTTYFCNVPIDTKDEILVNLLFNEGTLPVRYLGVPLISARLRSKDCLTLVEKIDARMNSWNNRFLSMAGRVQLIISLLSALHIYWASIFILPASTIRDLEAKIRGFLWCEGPLQSGKAKISWKELCVPKSEGGLGIRRLKDMNTALMAKHIWSILTHRDSLWVDWCYSYRLKGRSLWDVRIAYNSGWSWRKMMQIRPLLREYIRVKVGNGEATSAWYDWWDDDGPLCHGITPRMIHNGGLNLASTVRNLHDIVLPAAWGLDNVIMRLDIHLNQEDKLMWGAYDYFSASLAWDSIRVRFPEVAWYKVVWFHWCIPKHAFHLWLVLKDRLLTQERLVKWQHKKGNMNLMCCPLCQNSMDSIDHLFFTCPFSRRVWTTICTKTNLNVHSMGWRDIVNELQVHATSKFVSVMARLVLAASTYYLWQERNKRLFENHTRPPDKISSLIYDTVRCKLVSTPFKMNLQNAHGMEWWDLANVYHIDDEG